MSGHAKSERCPQNSSNLLDNFTAEFRISSCAFRNSAVSNPDQSTVLSIDAGSQSVRAALFSVSGARLSDSQQLCATRLDQSTVEQEPGAILSAAKSCLEKLAWDEKVPSAAIVSQGASIVCYRRSNGRWLSPVISWQDRRGAGYLGRVTLDSHQIHGRTGLPLSCHYGASKLRWCLDHLIQVAQAHQENDLVAGPLMSFLLHHLCLERPAVVDSSSASRTLLWNLHERQWDPVLTREFGVPAETLPTGLECQSWLGTLEAGGRQVPVTFASRDQQAALFAEGRPKTNTAYVNLGTGAFVQCLVSEPAGPSELLINRLPSSLAEPQPTYSLEGTVHGVAGAVPWMERHLGFSLIPKLLVDALTHTPPADKRITFVNGVLGMGSPYWRSEAIGQFSDGLTAEEKLLAWLESVVFMLVENLSLMSSRASLERLSISGGFSNLSGLVQRLADLSKMPCYVSIDREATLRGAAYLAASQPDQWQTEKPRAFLPTSNRGLVHRYQQWREAMGRIR